MTQSSHQSEKPAPAAPRAPASPPDSGWVLAPGSEPFSREELLARYRRQRALPDDPFEQGGKPTPPPGYRDRIMSQWQSTVRFVEREGGQMPSALQKPRLSIGQTFAIASVMALASGAGVGVVSATIFSNDRQPMEAASLKPVEASASAVLNPAPAAAALPVQTTTVINKKSVPIATLQVADASGETNSLIPLALTAEPAVSGSDMILKISGIPQNAYLTSGRKDDDQNWALTLGELKNLKLVIPESPAPKIDLAVAAFEPRTGELAAPVKTMTVALSDVTVQPASAPPPAQLADTPPKPLAAGEQVVRPQPIPPPDSTSLSSNVPATSPTQTLVQEGDALLKSGDVREARKTYEQAWAGGSPAGAFGIARSYDPLVLSSLALKNAQPDKEEALAWYERAATAGHVGAADSIVRLRLKP